jgi:hypothetical protein
LGDAGGAGLLAEGERDELGGFKWSLQRLEVRSCDAEVEAASV